MCLNHCGIDAYVQNGKIVKIDKMQEHPFNNLCAKSYAIPELVNSNDRLTTPLIKINGGFREVSWDEAFTVIVDKLKSFKDEFGAKAVIPFVGNAVGRGVVPKVVTRFADIYGTPNYTSGGWSCFVGRILGSVLTLGSYPNADLSPDNKCIVIWGKNPSESFPSGKVIIDHAVGRGSKLIVIDPIATRLAKRADIHAQIRPGTDCALALGLMNVIIAEGLYDKNFVESWTVGFEKLVEKVKDYPPERVQEITWIPAEVVKNIARMYVSTHPAGIALGVSIEHSSNGIQAIRAISSLMAICGNLDISGGNITYPGVAYKNIRLPGKVCKDTPVGADFPLFSKITGFTTASRVIDAILTEKPYPLKALLIVGGNPLVNWPESNTVKKAFEKLAFILVVDIFMTDTAKMADIVLPAASHLETENLRDGYFNHECLPLIAKSNRVVDPIGNCMEDWKIWAELGRRMGYAKYFPWKNTPELIEDLLTPSKISLEQLNENPGGIYYSQKKIQYYLKEGFNTPSRKVEIYSKAMDDLGYDPIPTFHEPVESPKSRPDLAEKYPLILITGPRAKAYTHSGYRQLPSLRRLYPEPFMSINPKTANRLGINDEDKVRVESPRGNIIVKAKLTEDIHPKTVSMLHGWGNDTGANVNCLTKNSAVDPVSGFPEFRASLCNIIKA